MIDFPLNGHEACIMRNRYIVFVVILNLEMETLEFLSVAALNLDLAGPEASLHAVAGIVQLSLSLIMVNPMFAANVASSGCG